MKISGFAYTAIAFLLCLNLSQFSLAQTASGAQASGTAPKAAAVVLSKDAQEDIAKHEKIAAAHTEAANCLKAGKPDSVCEGPLQQACKGIAIGKFCGMKH